MQIDKDWLSGQITSIRDQRHNAVTQALVHALAVLNQSMGAETAFTAVLQKLDEPDEPAAEADTGKPTPLETPPDPEVIWKKHQGWKAANEGIPELRNPEENTNADQDQ